MCWHQAHVLAVLLLLVTVAHASDEFRLPVDVRDDLGAYVKVWLGERTKPLVLRVDFALSDLVVWNPEYASGSATLPVTYIEIAGNTYDTLRLSSSAQTSEPLFYRIDVMDSPQAGDYDGLLGLGRLSSMWFYFPRMCFSAGELYIGHGTCLVLEAMRTRGTSALTVSVDCTVLVGSALCGTADGTIVSAQPGDVYTYVPEADFDAWVAGLELDTASVDDYPHYSLLGADWPPHALLHERVEGRHFTDQWAALARPLLKPWPQPYVSLGTGVLGDALLEYDATAARVTVTVMKRVVHLPAWHVFAMGWFAVWLVVNLSQEPGVSTYELVSPLAVCYYHLTPLLGAPFIGAIVGVQSYVAHVFPELLWGWALVGIVCIVAVGGVWAVSGGTATTIGWLTRAYLYETLVTGALWLVLAQRAVDAPTTGGAAVVAMYWAFRTEYFVARVVLSYMYGGSYALPFAAASRSTLSRSDRHIITGIAGGVGVLFVGALWGVVFAGVYNVWPILNRALPNYTTLVYWVVTLIALLATSLSALQTASVFAYRTRYPGQLGK